MKTALINVLILLGVAFGAFVLYVWNFGLFPRFLTIQWREEVRLHDGSVVWAQVKRTYERPGMRLDRYDRLIFRHNEYLVEEVGRTSPVSVSTRVPVSMIDKVDGHWYVVLFGEGPFGNHPDEPLERWGSDFTVKFERVARFDGSQFVPVPWEIVPPNALTKRNLIVGAVPVSELAKLDGKELSIRKKEMWQVTHPSGPGAGTVERPMRLRSSIRGEGK